MGGRPAPFASFPEVVVAGPHGTLVAFQQLRGDERRVGWGSTSVPEDALTGRRADVREASRSTTAR
jgi:hypothetical protein